MRLIEDHALIGDCRTAALVDRDATIDWLCLPRFDGAACFASLLGTSDNGEWQLSPSAEFQARRRYLENTMLLETSFQTATGHCRVIDFLATDRGYPRLMRCVEGLEGSIDLRSRLRIRFGYGRLLPWLTPCADGFVAISGPDLLRLRASVSTARERADIVSAWTVAAGQTEHFSLSYGPSHLTPPSDCDVDEAMRQARQFWKDWAGQCTYAGPWREEVIRSLLTLKSLVHIETGGIAAAPTTSLPERLGGERNWDYRFCWLRDATFVLLALLQAGYRQEAEHWRAWLVRACAGAPQQIQPIYGLAGEHDLFETEIPWLSGFAQSAPVRTGNAAHAQLQLDVFGEVMDVLHHARRHELEATAASWDLQRNIIDFLERHLDEPDSGIWEMRSRPRAYTYSRVMIWVAFDRAISAVEDFGLKGPVDRWRERRASMHVEICENGFDAARNTFTQSYGSPELDAALLLIPLVGFLPADDPRVIGTLQAVGRELMQRGFVKRYRTSKTDDGLEPGEGTFLACSFWYVDNLKMVGRDKEAEEMFERLLAIRNDVGLLAEEYDPLNRMMLGNFPQALSHLSLISSALNLQHDRGPARERTEHSRQGARARPQ